MHRGRVQGSVRRLTSHLSHAMVELFVMSAQASLGRDPPEKAMLNLPLAATAAAECSAVFIAHVSPPCHALHTTWISRGSRSCRVGFHEILG